MELGFRVRMVLPALMAVLLVLAWSCAQPAPGAIEVTVTATGPADGKTGDLQIEVREGSASGELRRFHVQIGYTLSSGAPFVHVFEDLAPGAYAVVAFLDVDSSETQTSGDAIRLAGPAPVTVVSDLQVPVATELDALQ